MTLKWIIPVAGLVFLGSATLPATRSGKLVLRQQ